ncbi:MAG TPA: hypothetical protein VMU68_01075 [Acidimicrobiales bacterium]|nr:hypothetical protein [Acidimicrobiales bacterium]
MKQWRHSPDQVIRKCGEGKKLRHHAEVIAEAKCAPREGRKPVREAIRDDYLYDPIEGEVRS